jgi:GNAT superfamily N-acetyltransferase
MSSRLNTTATNPNRRTAMTLHDQSLIEAAATAAPVRIRRAVPGDAEAAGRIAYQAFRAFQESHGFTPDFPSIEAAVTLASSLIADPKVFGVVAILGAEIVGSNFLTEGDPIRGIGPISVHPDYQGAGVGRMLMQAVIDHANDAIGVRLVQDAFNAKTMALYTALGFDAREPLALLTGSPRGPLPVDLRVRPMTFDDLDQADALSLRIHGFARTADLKAALGQATPVVLERAGRITAYMAMPTFWLFNHAVAETDVDLKALIRGASAVAGDKPLGFLVPIRRTALFRWCLDQGMQLVKPMTLMSRGFYVEPDGAYLPSVMY